MKNLSLVMTLGTVITTTAIGLEANPAMAANINHAIDWKLNNNFAIQQVGVLSAEMRLAAHPIDDFSLNRPVFLNLEASIEKVLGNNEIHGTKARGGVFGNYKEIRPREFKANVGVAGMIIPGFNNPPERVAFSVKGELGGVINSVALGGSEGALRVDNSSPIEQSERVITTDIFLGKGSNLEIGEQSFATILTSKSENNIVDTDALYTIIIKRFLSEDNNSYVLAPIVTLGESKKFLSFGFSDSVETISQRIINAYGNDGFVDQDTLLFSANITPVNEVSEIGFQSNSSDKSSGVEVESVPEPLTIIGSVVALGFGAVFKRQHSKKLHSKTKSLVST